MKGCHRKNGKAQTLHHAGHIQLDVFEMPHCNSAELLASRDSHHMVPSLKSFGGYLALHMYKVKQINLHPCALKRTWDNTALMRFDVVHSDDTRRRPAHLLALLRLVRAERAALE